jgi:hypothetical protein
MVLSRREVAKMVYELKNKSCLTRQDIQQTVRYQRLLDADAAILVTTGNASSFPGFERRSGVLVVRPAGAIAIAKVCCNFLVERARLMQAFIQEHFATARNSSNLV